MDEIPDWRVRATNIEQTDLCFRRRRRGSFDLALESWRRSRGSTSRDRGGRAARAGGRTTRARGGGSSSPRRQRAKDRVILTADQDSVRLLAQLVANLHVRDECPALDEVLLLADASVEVILERVGHGAPIVERLAQAGQPLDGAILYGRDPLREVLLLVLLTRFPNGWREVVRVVVLEADLGHAHARKRLVLARVEVEPVGTGALSSGILSVSTSEPEPCAPLGAVAFLDGCIAQRLTL